MLINVPTARATVSYVEAKAEADYAVLNTVVGHVMARSEVGYANIKAVIELDDTVGQISNIDTVDTDSINTDLLG